MFSIKTHKVYQEIQLTHGEDWAFEARLYTGSGEIKEQIYGSGYRTRREAIDTAQSCLNRFKTKYPLEK